MKRMMFMLGLFAFVLIGCNHQEKKENTEDDNSNKKSTLSGQDIYNQNCVSCHGAAGNMGGSGAKDLQISKLSKEEIEIQVTNGKGMMSSYKNLLSKEEIEHVAEYVLTLRK